MTNPKFNPAAKAALLKKFKNRQASKVEAVQKGFQKGIRMPEAQILITITPNSMNVESGNLALPLVVANLEMAKALTINRMIGVGQQGQSDIVQAPASILDKLNGRG